jgi:predicted MFS family arabinose efflux permease
MRRSPYAAFGGLFVGAGEGMVFTAGATWVVDLAPPHRRGRVIGLYGLAVWSGLSLGPPIGEGLYHAWGFDAVWAFAAICPFVGALVALRVPDPHQPPEERRGRRLIATESVAPGIGISLANVGYAAMASFIVLDLQAHGSSHGAVAFTAFAATVVLTRLAGGDLPDRIGPLRCAAGAATVEAAGLALIALSQGLVLALVGAVGMGMAFALLYPSLSLVAISRVAESRRGSALGTFTAFFDIGVGLGGILCGVAASLAGYSAAFWLGSAAALGTVAVASALRRAWAAPATAEG